MAPLPDSSSCGETRDLVASRPRIVDGRGEINRGARRRRPGSGSGRKGDDMLEHPTERSEGATIVVGVSAVPGWHPVRRGTADGAVVTEPLVDLVYNGGPVVGCPQIYAGFWGSQWLQDTDHTLLAGRLER